MSNNVIQLFAPYAGVICMGLYHGAAANNPASCGKVDLTRKQYDAQMDRPDSTWRCPKCGAEAWFDDERFEELHPEHEEYQNENE